MGFFDKLKGAVIFVTGGAAKVTVEWNPPIAFPGDVLNVRVTATSTGAAINSGGIFIDIAGHEQLNIPRNALGNSNEPISHNKETLSQTFQIAPPFALGPNETKQFEGRINLPPHAQPTYDGPYADHDWGIRGRLEMTGNDPDSGFQKFIVGKRA
jgi:hypothetical protein